MYVPPYGKSYKKLKEIIEVNKILEGGVIQNSKVPWPFPVFQVPNILTASEILKEGRLQIS
jgi:hypothetical protein